MLRVVSGSAGFIVFIWCLMFANSMESRMGMIIIFFVSLVFFWITYKLLWEGLISKNDQASSLVR